MAKRSSIVTAALAVAIAAAAYAGVYYVQKRQIAEEHAHLSSFDWFCAEFKVNEPEKKRILKLHEDYFPECEDHCVHYAESKKNLAEIHQDPNHSNNPEHIEALKRLQDQERDADKRFIDFVYAVSREMHPDNGTRYLKRMKRWIHPAGESKPTKADL